MKDKDMYPVAKDEALYWFDVLQNNSVNNIAKVTGIGRERVRRYITERHHSKYE